jgi:hypothetical protein
LSYVNAAVLPMRDNAGRAKIKEGTMVLSKLGHAGGVALLLVLAGCAQHEQHLEQDAVTCRSMGHVPETPEFSNCMKELNKRRCEELGNRSPMCR